MKICPWFCGSSDFIDHAELHEAWQKGYDAWKQYNQTDGDDTERGKIAEPEKSPKCRRAHIQQAMGRSGKSPEEL